MTPDRNSIRPSLKVLVVDDEEEQVELLRLRLFGLGPEFSFCTSGGQALVEIARAYDEGRPFDFYVLDCALPRFDGFTLARVVRSIERSAKLKPARMVFITAYSQTVDLRALLEEVGSEYCFQKPELERLPALLLSWIEGQTEMPSPMSDNERGARH